MRIKDIRESYFLDSWKKHTKQENLNILENVITEDGVRVHSLDCYIYLLENGFWMSEYAATFSEDF